MTGSQQNTAGGLSHANKIASTWRTQNTILTDKQLLHAVGGRNLGNLLHNLGIEVTTIAANDEERALSTLGNGQEDAGDESLRVMGLLEDTDLLPKT